MRNKNQHYSSIDVLATKHKLGYFFGLNPTQQREWCELCPWADNKQQYWRKAKSPAVQDCDTIIHDHHLHTALNFAQRGGGRRLGNEN